MKVGVDDALGGNHPAQIKVQDIHTVEELLVYAWEDHIRHCGELNKGQGSNGIMGAQLEGIMHYL